MQRVMRDVSPLLSFAAEAAGRRDCSVAAGGGAVCSQPPTWPHPCPSCFCSATTSWPWQAATRQQHVRRPRRVHAAAPSLLLLLAALLLPLLLLPLLPQGDGRYLISNSKDQTIKLWDTR